MTINYRILGAPGRDNALFVMVSSGQRAARLLFDCGADCLTELAVAEIHAIEHVFFSHFHMDHIAGFDDFFRFNFGQSARPNHLWGPAGSHQILQHRFQGFLWNMHGWLNSSWLVHDILPTTIDTFRYELAEAFAFCHPEGSASYDQVIWHDPAFTVQVLTLDHNTPSLGYIVRERARQNIDTTRLAALGLATGPWMALLKDPTVQSGSIQLQDTTYDITELRRELLVETPGDSIAYLTDGRLTGEVINTIAPLLHGCRTLVCEAQYQHADLALAEQHYHMTSVQTATLAQRAGVRQLILFHLSDRYPAAIWQQMLEDARQIFPQTSFPKHWQIT